MHCIPSAQGVPAGAGGGAGGTQHRSTHTWGALAFGGSQHGFKDTAGVVACAQHDTQSASVSHSGPRGVPTGVPPGVPPGVPAGVPAGVSPDDRVRSDRDRNTTTPDRHAVRNTQAHTTQSAPPRGGVAAR